MAASDSLIYEALEAEFINSSSSLNFTATSFEASTSSLPLLCISTTFSFCVFLIVILCLIFRRYVRRRSSTKYNRAKVYPSVSSLPAAADPEAVMRKFDYDLNESRSRADSLRRQAKHQPSGCYRKQPSSDFFVPISAEPNVYTELVVFDSSANREALL